MNIDNKKQMFASINTDKDLIDEIYEVICHLTIHNKLCFIINTFLFVN